MIAGTSTAPPPPRKKRNVSGFFNAAISAVALIVVVPLALQASHEPPPAVAEFAPQVQTQIKQAPSQQSSAFGNGKQGTGGQARGVPPTPTPTPPVTDVPQSEVKHCVGNPPRQTEDPQSPPCVPYWDTSKSNGGATSMGVTADTILLGEPSDCQTSTGSGESAQEYTDLVAFFNKRFQTYGRTVKPYCLQTGDGSATQSGQESDADLLAAQQPFAATMYRNGAGEYFSPRIGCTHHVISVTYYVLPQPKSYMDQCPGYIYQYMMDQDSQNANLGQWACARLAGGDAVHAAGNDNETPPKPMQSLPRKFGVIFEPSYSDEPGAVQPLLSALSQCGVTVDKRDVLMDPVQDPTGSALPEDPSQANNAILQMKGDNVTSIFCLCNLYTFGAFTRAADNESYDPEWLVNSYGGLDATVFLQDLGQSPTDQLQHTFGLSFKPREIPIQEEPYYQAMREVDPANAPKGPDSVDVEVDQEVYRDMLVLFSGIQMAGPDLTPQTFAQGLAAAAFPNPDTSTRAGHVGFAGFTYSMTIDGTEFYFGNGQPSPYPDTTGAICYVNDGKRYSAGSWPRGGDPFFQAPCDGVT